MLATEKFIRAFLFSILILVSYKSVETSKLEFYAGEYKNITIAISSTIDSSECPNLIGEIKNLLTSTSSKLFAAADGRFFSHIKILIPRNWNARSCGLVTSVATAADTYADADLKITESHPIAKSLPWTRQYRGCGQSSDDIIIPPSFVLSQNFTLNIKSQLILHEWAKFRYGVYEEHAYFGDDSYPACYAKEGNSHFTSCSNVKLDPVANITDLPAANCRSELNAKASILLNQLGWGTSSIMSTPNVETTSNLTFCTNQTHNRLAATKHNNLCNRRSVEDVVHSHPDFLSSYGLESKQIKTTVFDIVQHTMTNDYSPGYAFVIEDSSAIRDESRLRQIKQGIAQMVDQMRSGTMVSIFTFSGSVSCSDSPRFFTLTDDNKEQFLDLLPDLDFLPCAAKLSPTMAKQAEGSNNLYFAMRQMISSLNSRLTHKWHIFLITSSTSTAFDAARDELDDYAHSLSVLTFDSDPAWLQLYKAANLRNVMVLPNCFANGNVCSTRGTAFVMDEFVELLRTQDSPKFLQKVAEANLQKGVQNTFSIEIVPSSVTRFYVYLPVFTDIAGRVTFTSPSGTYCPTMRVLNYSFVLKLNTATSGCELQSGTWTVDMSSLPDSDTKYTIQAFAESSAVNSQLIIRGSLGAQRQSELLPNLQLTPVFARITDVSDRPVVHAVVDLKTFSSSSQIDTMQSTVLKDDGLDPDVMKNDGVYSAYLTDYSSTASYHIPQLMVTSQQQTRVVYTLVSENEYSAALLDSKFASKCCGSVVPIGNQLNTGIARYASIIPGFRTATSFDSSTLPPSKIDIVRIIDDDGKELSLQFNAPFATVGANGTVKRYDICCTIEDNENNICLPITSPSSCIPVTGGEIQNCLLSREGLSRDYIKNDTIPSSAENQVVFLHCGLRGVNSNEIVGQLSGTLLEIGITLNSSNSSSNCTSVPTVLKCDSLSDDCLPLTVFWGLIGCIGGLVLVILALIICWCWTYRKRKATKNGREEVLMTKNRGETPKLPDKDSPLYNVYVNKAYIQETDGQMKLVAADGELLPLDSNENNINSSSAAQQQHPIPSIRRRSVSVSADIGNDNKQPWLQVNNPDVDEMKVYKSHFNKPPPLPKPSTFLNTTRSDENLSAPVPRNRLPRMESSGYANSNTASPNKVPISSISSSIQDNNIDVPVYASVNRNGRTRGLGTNANYPVQPIASVIHNNTYTFQRPKPKPKYDSDDDDQPRLPLPMPMQNRFSRPLSSYSQPRTAESSRPSSSLRLDAFPSSESDSYSDMSRGIPIVPKPPPVPPPFPKNSASNNPLFQRNAPTRHNIQPKIESAKPPPRDTTGFGAASSKSPSGPPPPPPRQSKTQQPSNTVSTNQPMSDDDYDDDSEHWDDDDFDFNPGETHA